MEIGTQVVRQVFGVWRFCAAFSEIVDSKVSAPNAAAITKAAHTAALQNLAELHKAADISGWHVGAGFVKTRVI